MYACTYLVLHSAYVYRYMYIIMLYSIMYTLYVVCTVSQRCVSSYESLLFGEKNLYENTFSDKLQYQYMAYLDCYASNLLCRRDNL